MTDPEPKPGLVEEWRRWARGTRHMTIRNRLMYGLSPSALAGRMAPLDDEDITAFSKWLLFFAHPLRWIATRDVWSGRVLRSEAFDPVLEVRVVLRAPPEIGRTHPKPRYAQGL